MISYRKADGAPRIRRQDQLLYESADVRVGLFDARPDDPHFRFSAIPEEYLLVFPCTSARIEHAGQPAFVADRSMVTYYNPGELYRRARVSERGDRAHWFAFSPEFVREVLRSLDLEPPREDRLFRFSRGPSDATSFRLQSELVQRLTEDAAPPPQVEATARCLVRRALLAAKQGQERSAGQRSREIELVERTRELLARRYAEPLTLDELAQTLNCSTSHLSHSFRRVTGTTIHAHRNQLRLRRALLELPRHRGHLTDLGLELGYSSHSHFTERFRKIFGAPPRDLAWRGGAQRRRSPV